MPVKTPRSTSKSEQLLDPHDPRLAPSNAVIVGSLIRLLDGRPWEAETLDTVAGILRSSGYQIREPKDRKVRCECNRCGKVRRLYPSEVGAPDSCYSGGSSDLGRFFPKEKD